MVIYFYEEADGLYSVISTHGSGIYYRCILLLMIRFSVQIHLISMDNVNKPHREQYSFELKKIDL